MSESEWTKILGWPGYLLLKAQRLAATKTEFLVLQKAV
jgi:hypothetical protein